MPETTNIFKKAKTIKKKARILLRGTSGGGKTTSALILASSLGKKIALIDTEKMSSLHNASRFNFDVVDYNELSGNNHTPRGYIKMIDIAEQQGYEVVIIDSFSHVWMGEGGILEIVENIAKTKYKGNTRAAWKDGNQLYQSLVNKVLLGNNMHILVTGRTKQAYEMVEKKVIKRGMDLQQRDGLDFEFDIALDFSNDKPGFALREKDRTGIVPEEGVMVDDAFGKVVANYFNGD